MDKIKLALDWTPNVNHIGFLIAKEKGFYQTLGLDVEIIDAAMDDYKITPAKKVELGMVDFALCPTESIISYRTKQNPFDLIAVASILQEDLSAIVVRDNEGIDSPKDLDGKIYSSYKARYEDGIVKEMIKNDGGNGTVEVIYPDKLGIWNTLLNGEADATWIFLNWEGVAAKNSRHSLKYFKMRDYQIPYPYSPVLAASESKMMDNLKSYQLFIKGSKQGYLYAQNHPATAVEILRKYVPKSDDGIDLAEALKITSPHFGNEDTWGMIRDEIIAKFMDWVKNRELETDTIDLSKIATNRCL